MEEMSVDQELLALQMELDTLVKNWRMEYETGVGAKQSYEEQDKLRVFLEEKWDVSKHELVATVLSETLEAGGENADVVNLPEKHLAHTTEGLTVITLDGIEDLDKAHDKYKHVNLNIVGSRPLFQVSYKWGHVRLNLHPDEVDTLRLVRKKGDDEQYIKPRAKHGERYKVGDAQDFGYLIDTLPGLATAWQEADKLGEELRVKLTDGRVCIVGKGTMGPVEPTVPLFWEDDDGKSRNEKIGAWDFFRLEPVVYDPFDDKVN